MFRGLLRFVLPLVLVLFGNMSTPGQAGPLNLILPTRNDALLRDDYSDFYQFTDRNFRGDLTHPWEGGQYGFVRNLRETSAGIIYTRFHEGLDIKPLYRDERGEPLDTIRSVDRGRVVYANYDARKSNYGKYVVIEHQWEGALFYSLYAHMAEVIVHRGQLVSQGTRLGRMGYTGDGIDKRRAHVHFEINMLLNDDFERWHDVNYRRSPNPHGLYHGQNLAGIDVGALYLALKRNPQLTMEQFITRQRPYFKVVIPNDGPLDLLYRYPWLAQKGYNSRMQALEISFTQSGLPIRVDPYNGPVSRPFVSMVQPSRFSYDLATNHLTGGAGNYDLSSSGYRYLELLMDGQWGRSLTLAPRKPSPDSIQRAEVLPLAFEEVAVPDLLAVGQIIPYEVTLDDAPTRSEVNNALRTW